MKPNAGRFPGRGKKILGLRVTDRDGRHPPDESAGILLVMVQKIPEILWRP